MAAIFNLRSGIAAALLALIAGVGCSGGPDTGTVTGTVSVDGKIPAEGSSINFISTGGGASTAGGLIEQGKYSVKVPVGATKVEIRIPRPQGGAVKAAAPKAGPGSEKGVGGPIEESLPPEYNEKSTLTFEVKSGTNEKNWDVKSKK